jgi:hypothetical protein
MLSDLNKDLLSLESLLKHKWRLRKLAKTQDAVCKMAVNWFIKIIK